MVSSLDPLGQIANGLNQHSRHFQIISENLNHIHSVGVKQMRPEFRNAVQEVSQRAVVPVVYGSGFGGVTSEVRQDILRQGQVGQSNRPLDLALNGNGFFLVENRLERTTGGLPPAIALTRNGEVDRLVINENGEEITYLTLGSDQNFLLGWRADENGQIAATNNIGGLTRLQIDSQNRILEGEETTFVRARFNLDAQDITRLPKHFDFTYYDNNGDLQLFGVEFTRVDETNAWKVRFIPPEGYQGGGEFDLLFGADGELIEPNPPVFPLTFISPDGEAQTIDFDLGKTTSYNSPATILLELAFDGFESGELVNLRFAKNGDLMGLYSNEEERPLARIAIGDVRAREQLIPESGYKWRLGPRSGELQLIGDIEEDGRAELIPASLEYANMDIADLFSDMIATQRIYGALSKSLTTVDETTETAIAMKA